MKSSDDSRTSSHEESETFDHQHPETLLKMKVSLRTKMAKIKLFELTICLMMFHGSSAALNCSSPTPTSLFQELEKDLFSKNLIRPVARFEDSVNITLRITVLGILGVETINNFKAGTKQLKIFLQDEKEQTMTTVLWQTMEWNIAGLSWDEQKCGTARVSVPREKLWAPDVVISEIVDEDKTPKPPYVYLYNTGRVFDDRPVRVVSSCQLGIYNFPFDIQNCSLTFGSYLHFDTDIKMFLGNTTGEVLQESRDHMEFSGEWELSKIIVNASTLELKVGKYSQITYFLIMRRRPTPYVVNLLLPSCFLITVDLFSFLLPPQSTDRSSFKMTLILGYTVFLIIMNDLLPATGETTPLINAFFSISLALMVASLLETVFITNIQFSSGRFSAVPHWLSVLVLRYLAVVVCVHPKEKSNQATAFHNPYFKDSTTNTTKTISGEPTVLSDANPAEAPLRPAVLPEPALDELKQLSRDLQAIRLQMDKYFQSSKDSEEWEMIGIIIDRVLFGLYILFIVVSFITITGIWIWNNTFAA